MSKVESRAIGVGKATGIFLKREHREEVFELIKASKEKTQQVLSVGSSITMAPQQDPMAFARMRSRIDELVEEYGLPKAFYGIDKHGQFVLVHEYKGIKLA